MKQCSLNVCSNYTYTYFKFFVEIEYCILPYYASNLILIALKEQPRLDY